MRHTFLALIIFSSLILLLSCNENPSITDAFDHIRDGRVKDILKKSIESHGGLKKWNEIKKLEYTKDFALFDADGNQETFIKQIHSYDFEKKTFEIINSSKDVRTVLRLENNVFSRTKEGEKVDDSQENMQKSFNTSMYVLGIPFKLLDEGVGLKYMGKETLPNSKEVEVIQATYDNGKNTNHSTNDVWWYYFDTENYTVLANKVKTSDHDAIVDNLSHNLVDGLLFHGHRKSYRLDSLGHKDYLRAEYFYDNYILE